MGEHLTCEDGPVHDRVETRYDAGSVLPEGDPIRTKARPLRRTVIAAAAVGVVAFGGASGYLAGAILNPQSPPSSASDDGKVLPRKTPVPNTLPPLNGATIDYRTRSFTVQAKGSAAARVRLMVPVGWTFRPNEQDPSMVHFVDPTDERALRVESGFTPKSSPIEVIAALVPALEASQPYENDLQILSQTESTVTGQDGQRREVATLVYTYIPRQTRRYVIVRSISTRGGSANVEMSATGLPQDAKALAAVIDTATRSVRVTRPAN